jgi:hypothetical protein
MGKIEVNWMPNLHPKKKQEKTKGICLSPSLGCLKINGFFFLGNNFGREVNFRH